MLSLRTFRFHLMHYRRSWQGTVVSTVIVPAMLLAAVGLGVGAIAQRGTFGDSGGTYLAYVAPGLAVVVVVEAVAMEGMWRTYGGFHWDRAYLLQAQTPLTPAAMVAGHFLFMLIKSVLVSAGFVVVATLFERDLLPGLLWSLLPAVLTGGAWGALLMAFSLTRRGNSAFVPIQRLLLAPLFFLSGSLFPVALLPWGLRSLMMVTPNWHGVEVSRHLATSGIDSLSVALHCLALVAMAAIGLIIATRVMTRRLEA